MGRCAAPCDGTISRDGYREIVEAVRAALSVDARPAVRGVQTRLTPAGQPATVRGGRHHPPAAGDADPYRGPVPPHPQPRGVRRDRRRAEGRPGLGDPRHPLRPAGRRRTGDTSGGAAGGRARGTSHRRDCAEAARPAAGSRHRGDGAYRRLARAAGTRLIDIIGDWMWPLHAVLDHEAPGALRTR